MTEKSLYFRKSNNSFKVLTSSSEGNQVYLVSIDGSKPLDKEFITIAFNRKFPQSKFPNYEIDWQATMSNWKNRWIKQKRSSLEVDRKPSLQMIWYWAEDKTFAEEYNLFSQRVVNRISGNLNIHRIEEIAMWWQDLEAPRLLFRFERYAFKSKGKISFTSRNFLRYLYGNMKRGYVFMEAWRYLNQKADALDVASRDLDNILVSASAKNNFYKF